MRVKGNRQYSGSPFSFNWLPYVSDGYGYRVHPIHGGKDYHKAVDIAVGQGTEILAGHDGTVISAGDNGGYGLVVVLEGEDGLVTKYAHCSQLLVSSGQTVKMGDVIAKVGSTGDSTGPHLHFEVIKNEQYLNPLYFAITNDNGSSYIPPGSPGGVDIPDYPGAPMGNGSYAALMEEAQKHLGKPYVFGAKGPNSFDCSGFVCWSLSKSGVYQIATNAQGLYNACTPVSRANAQPGDLIFFTGTYNAGRPVTHVGIYIGNG
ncbi:peptidoglycan DD-metalloendopeptidase family protein, partial [Christensenellaceae bacterium OttesenSCG-928-M15]|nr:peptidoglycan DD-metalloendopeptidase family protein [Christensenellaceae bacterium OttesenSCG-928-M15]